MRILVMGATGMLGNAVFRVLAEGREHEVWGSIRRKSNVPSLIGANRGRLILGVDVIDQDALVAAVARVRPDVVINCVGLVKRLSTADDPLIALPINAMFPHRLAHLCAATRARVIHVSTDCVFSGRTGSYAETDPSDRKSVV